VKSIFIGSQNIEGLSEIQTIKITLVLLITIALPGCLFEHSDNVVVTSDKYEEKQNSIDDLKVESMIPKEEILKLVNNKKSADDLINTVHTGEELKQKYKLSRILQEMPPECIRYSNDKIYLIYKYDEGNYAFVLYNSLDEDSFPLAIWYLGKRLYLDGFIKLFEDKATLYAVQQFDPDGNYDSLYMGRTTSIHSYHHTVDGYMIRLDYYFEGSREICKITEYYGENNILYYNLLPIDRELIEACPL
jgi:hypothetical protein